MDLVSIPPYASWYICDIFSNLYKVPCLWVEKFIFVFSSSFHCKITLGALSPHSSGSIFEGFTLIGSLAWTLDCLIALPMNAFQSSINSTDNVIYRASCYFVLGIIGMIYYTLYGIWNYVASLANGSSPSTTFLSSFCYIAI